MPQEKTEQPTPKKRREAREEGQVAKSKEVTAAFTLLVSFLALYVLMGPFMDEMQHLMALAFTGQFSFEISGSSVLFYLGNWVRQLTPILLLLFLVIGISGGLAEGVQTKLVVSSKGLKPDFQKLDPINGAKQIFSKRALVELVKSLLKAAAIGYISYSTIAGDFETLMVSMEAGIDASLVVAGQLIFNLAIRVSIFLLVLSILDYLYQRWEHEQKLKMTKQEVKDERKDIEGDPLIQSEIKRRQREMATQRMMQEVPEADVVITNPTEIAVALSYDAEEMEAPVVVAMGERLIAARIKEVARQHGVEIVEERELARALYESTEVGDQVPPELYRSVAEILAFVYRLKHQL